MRQRQRLGVKLAQLGRQQTCLGLQRPGGGGGLGLAATAVKKQQIQLGLQVPDGHTHRRRHPPQRPRCGRKRAFVQHSQKHLHVVGGECHGANLSKKLK